MVRRSTRAGVIAAQVAHAATEALRELPVPPGTRVVVLAANSSDDLEELSINLSFSAIEHALVHEPDPPYNGAATALATPPTDRERVRAFFERFKLLR